MSEDEELTEMKTDDKGQVVLNLKKEDPDVEDFRQACREAIDKLTGE